MGRSLVSCIAETRELKLTGALTEPKHESLGRDAGEVAGIGPVGVPVTDDRKQALDGAQVAGTDAVARLGELDCSLGIDDGCIENELSLLQRELARQRALNVAKGLERRLHIACHRLFLLGRAELHLSA